MSLTQTPRGRSRAEIATRIAADLKDGWYVNLGIGIPTLVADHVAPEIEVMFHSEGGMIGIGPPPESGYEDADIVNAGKEFVTLKSGAATFDSAMSFAIIRGHHLDLAIMGGLQVDGRRSLANWLVPGGRPGVGGAMDLARGVPRLWIAMEHTDKAGNPKLVNECTLALTAPHCVSRVYTNLAIFDFTIGAAPVLTECAPGVSIDDVERCTEMRFVTDLVERAP